MTHTPGPWRIGTPPPNGEQTIGTNYGLMVAVATTGAGVESIANARLIAAAPDLVFQLLAAANYIDALGGDSKTYRAAIAKATGEQA